MNKSGIINKIVLKTLTTLMQIDIIIIQLSIFSVIVYITFMYRTHKVHISAYGQENAEAFWRTALRKVPGRRSDKTAASHISALSY